MTAVPCSRCHQLWAKCGSYGPENHCPSCAVEHRLLEAIPQGASVLDVGAGMAKYHQALYQHCGDQLALIEAYLPYVVAHSPPKDNLVFVGDALRVLHTVRKGVFDWVIAIDFIEHVERGEALEIISEMKNLAGSGVIVLTPRGRHEQNHDGYGMGGDYWQTHRSFWEPEDLVPMGFEVEVWGGFHEHTHPKVPDAMWAEWYR